MHASPGETMLNQFNFQITIPGENAYPATLISALSSLAFVQTIFLQLCDLISAQSGRTHQEVLDTYEKLYNGACVQIQSDILSRFGKDPEATVS